MSSFAVWWWTRLKTAPGPVVASVVATFTAAVVLAAVALVGDRPKVGEPGDADRVDALWWAAAVFAVVAILLAAAALAMNRRPDKRRP